MTSTAFIDRHCDLCGHIDRYFLALKEFAFELYNPKDYAHKTCSACGHTNGRLDIQRPALDMDVLDLWGQDEDLFLLSQDEDLILADERRLDLLLAAIDKERYLESKMYTLVYALLVLLYDLQRTGKKAAYDKTFALAQQRRPLLEKYRMGKDYVTKVMYPQLGLSYRTGSRQAGEERVT